MGMRKDAVSPERQLLKKGPAATKTSIESSVCRDRIGDSDSVGLS